jgi:hypothetical protein
VEHASTQVYCCFAVVLLAKNIAPYLVITCKAYNVFMLLLSSITEILAVTDELKGISCG